MVEQSEGAPTPRVWGFWTEGKLDLLGDYMIAFNTASSRKAGETTYLDLFAGTPENRRETGAQLQGSARRAFSATPPFTTVVLFEKDRSAAQDLRAMISAEYPGRDGRVFPGDCNETLPTALEQLHADGVAWRPTLAFLDPYKTNIWWDSFRRLSEFRIHREWKAELLILLHSPGVPRGAAVSPRFVDDVTRMFGTGSWEQLLAMRQAGKFTAGRFRYELGNLLRWRLEKNLGYRRTHIFQVRRQGDRGVPLYDLIFATDNAAGDKIMRDLFTRATQRFPTMARDALVSQRNHAEEESGALSLFNSAEFLAPVRPRASLYTHEPPHPPPHLEEPAVPLVDDEAEDPRAD